MPADDYRVRSNRGFRSIQKYNDISQVGFYVQWVNVLFVQRLQRNGKGKQANGKNDFLIVVIVVQTRKETNDCLCDGLRVGIPLFCGDDEIRADNEEGVPRGPPANQHRHKTPVMPTRAPKTQNKHISPHSFSWNLWMIVVAVRFCPSPHTQRSHTRER